jgi:hypothetical protein
MTKPLFIKPDNASQLVIGNSTDSDAKWTIEKTNGVNLIKEIN